MLFVMVCVLGGGGGAAPSKCQGLFCPCGQGPGGTINLGFLVEMVSSLKTMTKRNPKRFVKGLFMDISVKVDLGWTKSFSTN